MGRRELRAWVIAIRPHTLPAGMAPVVVGVGIAWSDGLASVAPATAALVGAVLIQIGTNLANDYYDAQRGVDTDERSGFTRVTHAGLLAPVRVKRAMWGSFLLAIGIGTYLVYVGGLPIAVIGLLSVMFGIAYAGGPAPFGSYALGDVFVFVCFGLVAVTGTYYVQAVDVLADPFPLWIPPGTISSAAIAGGVALGALTTAILVVNNLRDIATDRAAGKYTLAVLIGPTATKGQYVGLLCLAYLVPLWFRLESSGWAVLLPLMTAPAAAVLIWRVLGDGGGETLNVALSRTGQLTAAYALLFAIGVAIA